MAERLRRVGDRARSEGASESALVQAMVAGDEAAFARIWRTLNPLLIRYARVVAPDAADDVASEAWATVIAALHRFSGDAGELRAWLFTCARRRALDHHRRQRRRPADRLDLVAEAAGGPEPEPLWDVAAGTAEAIALVRRLPPDVAEVVALRVIAGLSVDEVAALVGRPPGTVRVMAHRGLRRLEGLLAPATSEV